MVKRAPQTHVQGSSQLPVRLTSQAEAAATHPPAELGPSQINANVQNALVTTSMHGNGLDRRPLQEAAAWCICRRPTCKTKATTSRALRMRRGNNVRLVSTNRSDMSTNVLQFSLEAGCPLAEAHHLQVLILQHPVPRCQLWPACRLSAACV